MAALAHLDVLGDDGDGAIGVDLQEGAELAGLDRTAGAHGVGQRAADQQGAAGGDAGDDDLAAAQPLADDIGGVGGEVTEEAGHAQAPVLAPATAGAICAVLGRAALMPDASLMAARMR